jgi:hypothetical protein
MSCVGLSGDAIYQIFNYQAHQGKDSIAMEGNTVSNQQFPLVLLLHSLSELRPEEGFSTPPVSGVSTISYGCLKDLSQVTSFDEHTASSHRDSFHMGDYQF